MRLLDKKKNVSVNSNQFRHVLAISLNSIQGYHLKGVKKFAYPL